MIIINKSENTLSITFNSMYPSEELARLKRALLAASRWYNDSDTKEQDSINFQTLIFLHEALLGEEGL